MATKGWSFGALTDALKSAAFLDAGQSAGQVALIDTNNRVTAAGITNVYTGFRAAGVEQNDVFLYSSGNRAINGVTGELSFNWYNTTTKFQHLRGNSTDSIGFNIAWSGTKKIHYQASSNKIVANGDLFSTNGLVIGSQSTNDTNAVYSDWFRVTANSATEFILRHTGRQWRFTPYGGIVADTRLSGGAGDAFVRAMVGSGDWNTWRSRAPMVQVDLDGYGASTGLKFTQWGVAEIASISAANSGSAGSAVATMEFNAGTTSLYLSGASSNNTITLNTGGMTVATNLVAGNIVYGGGGSSYMGTDGNIIGSIWGGALNAWLNNSFNNVVRDVRYGGEGSFVINKDQWCKAPIGAFMTGWYYEGDNPGGDSVSYRYLQVYIQGGWRNIG